jgi:hypothetical protein
MPQQPARLREHPSSSAYFLSDNEKKWVAKYDYLLQKGYKLRPRYRPGWDPVWRNESDRRKISRHEGELS